MRILVLILFAGAVAGAAEPQNATGIAAGIIRARAHACDAETAKHLLQLADGVEAGRIDLAQARQVLELVTPSLPPRAAGRTEAPAPTATTAKDVTALLDADRPSPPPPPVEEAKAAEESADAPPAAPKITSTVLAIGPAGGDHAALIMIGAGEKSGVKVGDRFQVRRSLKTIATCEITQVKDAMSICMVIPGTFVDAHESIKEGDDAVSVE